MWQTEIGYYGSFFAIFYYPPNNAENQIFLKKSFYTYIPKIMIKCTLEILKKQSNKWCMLPEIYIVKNWRYYPFTSVYHKWRSYDAWFLRYKAQQFFVNLDHFLSFDSQNWRYYDFTLCKTNDNHICMVPDIWSATDIIFCHFELFCPFTPLTTRKIKILKKWKTYLKILFYTCVT